MTDPVISLPGDADEVPVPLVGPSLGAPGPERPPERPVDLMGDVGEPKGMLMAAADKPEDKAESGPSQPGLFRRVTPPAAAVLDAARAYRRALGAALVALACVGAFTHGWHVGAERLRPTASEQGGDVVNHITYQEEEGR